MTVSRTENDARVGVAAALAVAGTIAGIAAFLLDKYLDAKTSFVLYSLVALFGGFYTSSIVAFVKALGSRSKPTGSGLGRGALTLYMFMHYSIAVISTILAVGLNDSAQDMGGFAAVMAIFAVVNAAAGLVGGVVFGMLVYLTLTERGWNSVAAFITSGIVGLIEGALCYVVQFNLGSVVLPNV